MTAHRLSTATPLKTTINVVDADPNRGGGQSTDMKPQHRAGDTVDQVSSIALLDLAVVGAGVTLVFHWLPG